MVRAVVKNKKKAFRPNSSVQTVRADNQARKYPEVLASFIEKGNILQIVTHYSDLKTTRTRQ
jgi:hypothetical protein